VAADIDLIVGGIEIPGGRDYFDLIVPFETRWRDHVEESVGPVAVLTRKTAALDLEFFHVFGINQRRDVGRDIRVDHGYAVEKPVHLMAAAHVQHVVNHVSSRREIGNHRQAVGLIRSGRLRNFLRRDHGLNGRHLRVQLTACARNFDARVHCAKFKLNVQNWPFARDHNYFLLPRPEPRR